MDRSKSQQNIVRFNSTNDRFRQPETGPVRKNTGTAVGRYQAQAAVTPQLKNAVAPHCDPEACGITTAGASGCVVVNGKVLEPFQINTVESNKAGVKQPLELLFNIRCVVQHLVSGMPSAWQ